MKRLICFIVLNLILLSAWCQRSVFNNTGASVYMMPGSYMIVKGDSLRNYSGTIQNAGDLRVDGDIYNDAGATITGGPATPTGLYDIGGNWVNSGTFTAYQDTVMLNGPSNAAIPQLITGSQVSAFYDLVLTGTSGSAKTQTLNATVSNTLNLGTDELATAQFEMYVLNASPAAITKTNLSSPDGYVSSTGTGRLSRLTNSTSAYLFPTGTPSSLVSATSPFYYSPVDLTPTSAAANIYGARLVDNPDTDSLFVSRFDDTLCSVNPHFYHVLYQTQGSTPVAISIYFDPVSDGYWTDMAHWGLPHINEWNYMGTSTEGSGYGLSSVEIHDWSHFAPDQFALAAKKFYVNAGPNRNVSINQSVPLNATITASNVTSIVWAPDTFLNDNTIADPTFNAVQTTEYIIVVTDQAGCVASDTLTLTVLPDVLLIPTAFSPNGDGVNDLFRPKNPNLNTLVFQVFDRWGQKVYETDVIGDGWDGNYKGRKQDMGVYVWQAEYSLTGLSQTFTASGNVTLIR